MQRSITDTRVPGCFFAEHIEYDDHHCLSLGLSPRGYDVLSEDSPDIDLWLATVRGITLRNVTPQEIIVPLMPDYIPSVRKYSHKLLVGADPEYIAVMLGDVVSGTDLKVATDLRQRFGGGPSTKYILLGYGQDKLIENIWPHKERVFAELSKLGFVLATAINYSIWMDQPHAERKINIKRSLITMEDMQRAGMPAVPHIYWSGKLDLEEWAEWLNIHRHVSTVAINLQTIKPAKQWALALEELRYFVGLLNRPIHFLITGPEKLARIRQVYETLPSVTLTNAYASRMAAAKMAILTDNSTTWSDYQPNDLAKLFADNTSVFAKYTELQRKKHPSSAVQSVTPLALTGR